MSDPCCQPSRHGDLIPLAVPPSRGDDDKDGMVEVPAGPFLMGNERAPLSPGDAEGPVRAVHVDAFRIDRTAVTVAAFRAFVAATGWRTDAERYGWSYVFVDQVAPGAEVLDAAVPGAPWWRAVRGADWRSPDGPGSAARDDHPVVHVAWHDARAYARWAGKRLPTEPEWEKAARGGLEQKRYPWGDEIAPGQANVWEGDFPSTRSNGAPGTLPAASLEPNGLGLFHTAGNVWEWTADAWAAGRDERVVKGGSYLCHPSYCHRYRVAGRTFSTPDSSTAHTGFRCVAEVAREGHAAAQA
ncbi:MAG TPA: formylglycine-generating enzyme family protein [Mycobacteriales bacterium]|nr:formylglycine-generating enzyme family protein [Mycobacteriales bacterium]